MSAIIAAIGYITYLFVGFIQLVAIYSGLEAWLALPGFINFLLALFLAWFPLVGSILGMYGAVTVWGWSWIGAGLLFFGATILFFIAASVGGLFSLIQGR